MKTLRLFSQEGRAREKRSKALCSFCLLRPVGLHLPEVLIPAGREADLEHRNATSARFHILALSEGLLLL